jgi:uncharacterized membrane protein
MAAGVLFQALIVPHRSLTPRGMRSLILLILGCTTLVLLRFLLIRAWIVLPFSIIETGLAVGLLLANARVGRASELVILTNGALSVIRTDRSGRRQERRVSPAWVQVVLEESPGAVSRLVLATHGIREEIGAALGEEEKRDLAAALRDALWRMRNPRFDNPQLRGDG